MELLDFVNDRVVISDQLANSPLFITLRGRDKSKGGEKFYKEITYMFFVYSRKSIYFDADIDDRKKIVCVDILKQDIKFLDELKGDDFFEQCVVFFIERQYSKSEKLLNGMDQKIDEYLEFYKTTKITEENHNIVAQALKNASDLIDLREKVQKKVLNEKAITQQGGGTSKLFED